MLDRVTLLADVAEIVSRSHDLDETLNNVVDLVAKRLDADVCSLYLCGGADLDDGQDVDIEDLLIFVGDWLN